MGLQADKNKSLQAEKEKKRLKLKTIPLIALATQAIFNPKQPVASVFFEARLIFKRE